MNKLIAGTVIEESGDIKGSTFLSHIFSVTKGLTQSQVREITGLDAPALQNWIKRGWTSSPVNKKYNIDQVARILLINTLRDCLKLEKIAFLMKYINGDTNSRLDDIIPENQLYSYFCSVNEMYKNEIFDISKLDTYIDIICSDYEEILPDGEKRLKQALKIIVTAYRSAILKKEAEDMLEKIREDFQEKV